MGESYEAAGVSIDAGEEAVRRIKDKVRATFRPEVIGEIGGFGGLFALDAGRYRQPVLVASTDGVGTKAMIAQATGRFDTIGLDLVAMCVDDLVCQGAEPLFFLDYIAVGRLDPDHVTDLVHGIAEGCKQAGCALIGLPSPGLRSNGYSLARRVLLEVAGLPLDGPAYAGATRSLADELLEPSVIYAPAIVDLLRRVEVRAIAHITGGGFPHKLGRVVPEGVDAVVHRRTWETPRIFDEIQRLGDVSDEEMARVFNLGIGMVVAVPPDDAFRAIDALRASGHRAVVVGDVAPGTGVVRLVD
jgi:phosphoribosylformylglycinamidine cyclo-ligase